MPPKKREKADTISQVQDNGQKIAGMDNNQLNQSSENELFYQAFESE